MYFQIWLLGWHFFGMAVTFLDLGLVTIDDMIILASRNGKSVTENKITVV